MKQDCAKGTTGKYFPAEAFHEVKICIWNIPCQWCSSKDLPPDRQEESKFVAFLPSMV